MKIEKISFLSLWIILTIISPLQCFSFDESQTFVETNQAKLFCRSMGKGPPLIVLHGGPGLSQEYLLPQMNKLAEDHFVIFYDQRGSGRSENGNEASFIQLNVFVDDLEAIQKAYGLQKVSILGHSWGGFLGLHYAMSHPEAVDKLILLNPFPACSSDVASFLQEWSRRMTPHMDELEQIKNSKEYAKGDPQTIAKYLNIIFRNYCFISQKADELNLLTTVEANLNWIKTSEILSQSLLGASFDYLPDLKKISSPTLIVHGDGDPIPLSTAENLHKNIPHSKFVVIKECGHFPYVEKPLELFKILDEFFQN